jgi:hypothetical protein
MPWRLPADERPVCPPDGDIKKRLSAKHVTESTLRTRFGPEAIITRFGAIWMVHLDQPSKAEILEREAELQQELLEPEDCGCCDLMRPQAGDTIIFDGPMCLIEPAPWRKLFPDLDDRAPEGIAASN